MSTPTIKDIRAAAAARRQRRVRRRRLFVGVVGLVVLIGVGGFFGVAPLIKSQFESRGADLLKRDIAVERVTFNPFTFTATIEGVAVADHDGSPLFAWRRLVVDGGLWSTLTGTWAADSIELDGFAGRLAVDARGRLNIADVIEGLSDDGRDSRPLDIGQLTVTDAQLVWSDASRNRPFETTFGPITFSLADFHTKSDPHSPYEFEAMTESGESLVWDGTLSLSPLRSEGRLAVRGLQLSKYTPYMDELAPMEFTSGVIDASSAYAIDWIDEALSYSLSHGDVSVKDLTVSSAATPDRPQSLATLAVSGLAIDSVSRTLAVENINLAEGGIAVSRDSDGLSWMGMRLGGEDQSTPEATGIGAVFDTAVLGRVRLEQIDLSLTDHTLTDPVDLSGTISVAEVAQLDLADLAQSSTIGLEATLTLGGTVSINGSTVFEPFTPDFELEVKDVSLVGLVGHLAEAAGVQLVRGTGSARGRLSGVFPDFNVEGDGYFEEFWILDSEGENVGGARSLVVPDVTISSQPSMVRLGVVEVQEPKVYLRILENGEWSSVGEESDDPPTITFEDSAETQWEVETIVVSEGHLALRDESLAGPMTIALHELSGSLAGWSSRDVARAQVELDGLVSGEAPISIRGDLNPLGRLAFADLKIHASEVALDPFDGYISKYLGYAVTDGSMSLDIDFKLRDQGIESETVAVLNQFTLGEKTPGPDAIKLPVKFAMALLKDKDGEIVVDVPVSGHLEDPNFKFDRVIWRVFSNLLAKAVSSPFAILGGASDGEAGAAQLQIHAFAEGEATLSYDVIQNLNKLGDALRARSTLAVDLVGGYDLVGDRDALRPVALDRALRRRAGPSSFDANGEWNPQLRVGLLVGLYQEVFNEMPIDLNGALPPETEPELPTEIFVEDQTAEEKKARTLMTWLRKVFLPREKPTDSPVEPNAPVERATFGSFPAPEGLRTELAVLPVEEIVQRLLPEQEVEEVDFLELAQARAEAVRAHLISAGIDASRLSITGVEFGSSLVTLSLR